MAALELVRQAYDLYPHHPQTNAILQKLEETLSATTTSSKSKSNR